MKTKHRIDFVIPWVDGNDPEWTARYAQYRGKDGDAQKIRFRDWELLRYWFRAIEKFAPWYGNIFFITSGERPEWLNTEHPQLQWITHEDYIPKEYLPTFNSHTIELNLHRIKELSEHFVYFNDDIFITKEIKEEIFFKKGLPCDMAVLTAKPANGGVIHIAINDLEILEKHFSKREVVKKNPGKWLSAKYGKKIVNNILLYPWSEFSGFIDPHMPNAFLKSTFVKVWDKEEECLDKTCKAKFRTNDNVNQWLMRYWQLAEGNFHPINKIKSNLNIDINDSTIDEICKAINTQKYNMICLNDSDEIADFEKTKKELIKSFENILPEKSSFEI